ncbi:MAG: hypothetical protein NXI32_12680 [bacterium]|nr:hypothetical protein [bacterium]
MDTTIKYAALVIFLIVVIAVMWTLRDGFPIGRGRSGGPIVEDNALAPPVAPVSGHFAWDSVGADVQA